MPYCFGMRGERPTGPRQSTQAVVVAKCLEAMAVDKAIVVGLHTDAIASIMLAAGQGVKVEHLPFEPIAANYVINRSKERDYRSIVIASPDAGGTKRARETAKIVQANSKLSVDLAIGDKQRKAHDQTEVLKIVGDVKGKTVFLYDDIGDTLGTIHGAIQAIQDAGARELYLVLIHPVLGRGYEANLEKISQEPFVKEIVFGNTIPLKSRALEEPKVRTIPLEPLIAEAIKRINQNKSMSELHQYPTIMGIYENCSIKFNGKNIQIKRN